MSMKCIPPHTPLLYSKSGVYKGIPIFLFLIQNIDCGYSLEIYVSSKNKKNIKIFLLKIFNFYNFDKICLSHGHVFVMCTSGIHVISLAQVVVYDTMTSGKHVRVIYTPLKPPFYIAKLGCAGVYLFFLFLLQNIDCGYSLEPPLYSLEPPHRGGSNVYQQSMF